MNVLRGYLTSGPEETHQIPHREATSSSGRTSSSSSERTDYLECETGQGGPGGTMCPLPATDATGGV
eukprot:8757433-Pyramimonas_sp.AAC.1